MNCLHSKKALRGWLVAFVAVLALACAARFGCGLCWLQSVGGVDLQASQSFESYLLGYHVGGEGQDGLVSIFADAELFATDFNDSLTESAPECKLTGYGLGSGADECQAGALVLKVRDERDFYFTVLVAEDHGLLNVSYLQVGKVFVPFGFENQLSVFAPPQDGFTLNHKRDIQGVDRVVASHGMLSADLRKGSAKVELAVIGNEKLSSRLARNAMPSKRHGVILAQQHTPRNTRAALSGSSTTAGNVQPTNKGAV